MATSTDVIDAETMLSKVQIAFCWLIINMMWHWHLCFLLAECPKVFGSIAVPDKPRTLYSGNNKKENNMEKEKKQLGVAFIVVLVAIVMVSAIGIIAMSNKPVVLQGQIEATEIRISGKLPGRIDTFLVREGQYVKMGDTLVVINSPEAWAKFQQVNALEDIAKFQNKKIDDGTRRQIVRSVEELWNKSKSDLQLATVTYDRIQALYKDSVVTSQRKDEVEAMYKAAVAAERAAHQQFLLVKDGAQKEDKESARSLVDAARGTVNEVQALLMDARLTAPEDGQISTIYPKRGELVGAGTPIMSLVVLDDCHVVLNVREDYMPYFRMNENFMGDIPALDVKTRHLKSITSARWGVLPLGVLPSRRGHTI